MADVHLAIVNGARGFERLFALKVLRLSDEHDNDELVQMFENEARLAALLNHPNIVQAADVGEDENGHFIAMEYLEGQPLSRVRQRCRERDTPLPLEEQFFVLCQVLDALDYAHTLKDHRGNPLHLVHRDVSPQNIFLTYAGVTKLVDFGIAKTLGTRTRIGVVKGKVPYMSPEQACNRALDRRSDLFSVGIILWEAIAGRRMWRGVDDNDVQRRLADGELPALREAVPDVSAKLEAIVARALAPDLEKRYADAATFRQDLLAALDGKHVDSRRIGERVAALFEAERKRIVDIVRAALPAEDATSTDDDEESADSLSSIDALTTIREQRRIPPEPPPLPRVPVEPVPDSEREQPGTRRVRPAASSVPSPGLATSKPWLRGALVLGGLTSLVGVGAALRPDRSPGPTPPVRDILSLSASSPPISQPPISQPPISQPPISPPSTSPSAEVAELSTAAAPKHPSPLPSGPPTVGIPRPRPSGSSAGKPSPPPEPTVSAKKDYPIWPKRE